MDTIEALGRRAGNAALADAATVADPDNGLGRIRDDVATVVAPMPSGAMGRKPARTWAVVAAAAALVAIVATAVVIAGRDETRHLSPDPTPSPVTTAPAAPRSSPPTTSPAEPTTTAATLEPDPGGAEALAVSYLEPPPELGLSPFASVELTDADQWVSVTVAEDGVLVRLGERSYQHVTWDGAQTPIEFDVPLSLWVAGPGGVAYGTTGDPQADFRLAAVALGGDRAGQEVWSMPVNAGGDMLGEGPWGGWGHGPTGITQRSDGFGGQLIAPYVDETGAPLTAPIEAPDVFLTHTFDPDHDVVQSLDGTRTWNLDITAHPDAQEYEYYAYSGYPQAIPSADGGAIIWREIGALDGAADFRQSSLAVMATLRPDGTGQWFTIPEGWRVLASDLWGTVLGRSENGRMELARPNFDQAPGQPSNLCAQTAQLVVNTLVSRRLTGEGAAGCLDLAASGVAEPPCWIECVDGRLTAAEVGAVGETYNAVTDEPGWYAAVAVTFTNEFGFRTQRQEGWTLRRTVAGDVTVTAIDVALDAADASASEALVREYLGHIAAGRYGDAAVLLGASTAPVVDRPDLQQLGPRPETDIAGALQAWCEAPAAGARAVCAQPDALSTNITPTTLDVTAWYVVDGRVVTATFNGGTSEGVPFVRGIPPRAGPLVAEEVATLATSYRTSRMVVPTSTGFWLVADGSAVFIDTDPDGWPRIDGDFAYWDDGSGRRSRAFRLDGTEVCSTDGSIHHVRERAEGGYVATVERATGEPADGDETPVPAFAVDCTTGDAQPIAPVSWTAEAESRGILEVGDRTFTAEGDAEGNVVIANETDIRVTGPEWAISADFTVDGATVVYGEGGVGNPGVHDTNRLVARDTTTGAMAWSIALPQRFSQFWIVGDEVMVAHEPPVGAPSGMVHAEYTIVSLATGEIVGTAPAMMQVQDMA